jgi:hypothetical protein
MPASIETQFPIARLSAEVCKERKANNGQTLKLFGEENESALVLGGYLHEAYEEAEHFSELLQQRVRGEGFFMTLSIRHDPTPACRGWGRGVYPPFSRTSGCGLFSPVLAALRLLFGRGWVFFLP